MKRSLMILVLMAVVLASNADATLMYSLEGREILSRAIIDDTTTVAPFDAIDETFIETPGLDFTPFTASATSSAMLGPVSATAMASQTSILGALSFTAAGSIDSATSPSTTTLTPLAEAVSWFLVHFVIDTAHNFTLSGSLTNGNTANFIVFGADTMGFLDTTSSGPFSISGVLLPGHTYAFNAHVQNTFSASGAYDLTFSATPQAVVPEPGTLLLLTTGLVGLLGYGWRRRQRAA